MAKIWRLPESSIASLDMESLAIQTAERLGVQVDPYDLKKKKAFGIDFPGKPRRKLELWWKDSKVMMLALRDPGEGYAVFDWIWDGDGAVWVRLEGRGKYLEALQVFAREVGLEDFLNSTEEVEEIDDEGLPPWMI